MCKKPSVITNLLILIAVSFVVTACGGGVRVGDLQTRSQTVELDGADSVKVDIQMGAGELGVSGGTGELLEASFTYNVQELDPRATYTNGRLEVKDSDVRTGIGSLLDLDKYRNEWGLKLNQDVPMEMNIDLGAGHSNLVLGSLALTRLNVNGGAGDVELDLTGEWQNDLDANFSGGVGDVHLRLPGDVGVIVNVETGIGGVNTSGLDRDGDTYTNDAYGVSDVTLRIDIEGGVGQIHLDVE